MRTALIAGIVAAVVAAASSTAATIVITSKQIKDGTIQAVDLSAAAKRALKGTRGARGAVGAPGPQGAQGFQGPQGVPGTPSMQRLRLISSATVTIPPQQTGTADAICPPGEIAVSGGYTLAGPEVGLFKSAGTGGVWTAEAENSSLTVSAQLTALAYCAPGVTFVP
jgi:hypothetical protein